MRPPSFLAILSVGLCTNVALPAQVENRSLLLTFPIMFNPVTWDAHAFPVYFGGSEVDGEGLIQRVPSVQLVYFAKADNKAQDAK